MSKAKASSILKVIFLFILLICSLQLVRGNDCDYRALPQKIVLSLSHTPYLGLYPTAATDGKMLYFIRKKSRYTPGDYFRPPMGADPVTLTDIEKSEMDSTLMTFIFSSNINHAIIESLNGYTYAIAKGTIIRREFHVSYACDDTIFVVSGWFGKFISFYKAVPGDFRYDVAELQSKIAELSPSYHKAKKSSFRSVEDDHNYLLEYIDKNNLTRIRNYLISGPNIFGFTGNKGLLTYNLIEITKFIDPEAMP